MEYEGYQISWMGTFSLVEIKNKGQGPAPKPLKGRFTSVENAKKAIDSYLSSKGTRNGKTKSTVES